MLLMQIRVETVFFNDFYMDEKVGTTWYFLDGVSGPGYFPALYLDGYIDERLFRT